MHHYPHELSLKDQKKINNLFNTLKKASKTYCGYPANSDFDYSALNHFLSMSINNIGDPNDMSNYHVNTHEFEREVLEFFAKLYHLHEPFAGYVTNGGTEGNLFGLFLGSYHQNNGIIYYSKDSHYSIEKIIRIIKADAISINTDTKGEMDYDNLYKNLKKNKERPAILLFNIGTTMKGAIDNIEEAKKYLYDLKIKNHFMHCDAALHGGFLPFVKNAPSFDFKSGIDSIAVSGHKFIGSPIPCGIALAKKKYLKHLDPKVSYVRIKDSTISGSRDGITPLYLWYAIKRIKKDGFIKMTKHCLNLSQDLTEKLNDIGVRAYRNPFSNIVVFPKPKEEFVEKWQVATCDDIAHIIVMPQHTKEFFDEVVRDLKMDHLK